MMTESRPTQVTVRFFFRIFLRPTSVSNIRLSAFSEFSSHSHTEEKSNSNANHSSSDDIQSLKPQCIEWETDFTDLRRELRNITLAASRRTDEVELFRYDRAGFTPGCR